MTEPEPTIESTEPEIVEMDDLAAVRQMILESHPDIVPELVQGDSIAELLASIDPARAAYTRVIDSAPTPPAAVTIPAGGNAPITIDIEALPTSEKIRRGLAAQRS